MTTIYIPRSSIITGSDLTGSSEDKNRTYTLPNSSYASGTLRIYMSRGLLYEGATKDYTVSSAVITFLDKVWDTDDIAIYYSTEQSGDVSAISTYGTPTELARFMQIESFIPSPDADSRVQETVGTGDGSTTDFFLDKGYIINDTFTISYGSSLSVMTALVEDTDYDMDLDLGKISLTSTGKSTVSTATIYGKYSYVNTTEMGRMTNQMFVDALARAKSDIEDETSNHWANGTDTTPDYTQVTNEKHKGKGGYDRDYYLNNFPLPDVSTTLSASVATTDTTITVSSTDSFLASGTILIGTDKIAYTGKTDTTFTGVSGIDAVHTTATVVDSNIIEISTSDSGSEPVWEVLDNNTGYDLDLDTGKVTVLDSSGFPTSYGSYPPRGIPNRFRATYIWGNDTIPSDVRRLNLMMAAKELQHGVVRKNISSGQGELAEGLVNIDQEWIDKTLNRLRVGRTFNT